jgi:hypothetical protein
MEYWQDGQMHLVNAYIIINIYFNFMWFDDFVLAQMKEFIVKRRKQQG